MYDLYLRLIDATRSEQQANSVLSPELLACAPGPSTRGNRRAGWLAGRILLARVTRQIPLAPLPLGSLGKPMPPSPAMPAFNISHSGDRLALLVGPAGHGVGCDIEKHRPRARLHDIARHYFSTAECQWLCGLQGHRQQAGFWKLWTLREAILKFLGASIWQMHTLELSPEAPYSSHYNLYYQTWQDCSVACCVSKPGPLTLRVDNA